MVAEDMRMMVVKVTRSPINRSWAHSIASLLGFF